MPPVPWAKGWQMNGPLLVNCSFLNYFSKSWDNSVNSYPCILKIMKPSRILLVSELDVGVLKSIDRKAYGETIYFLLTIDIHMEWFFSSSSNIGGMTCICCWIRDLCSRDMKKLSFINIKCLGAGNDWLAIPMPSNGRHRQSPRFTFQFNYAVDQCWNFCGDIPSFNTRWNCKGFQNRNKFSKP